MKRIHYLAAEIFFYSYDNYEDHLGINQRFDRLMPEDAEVLEAALDGNADCDLEALGKRLGVDEDVVLELLERTKNARRIVDAESPVEGFREGVRQSIANALKEGLDTPESIDALAEQVCYRAADLSFLLKERAQRLEDHSEALRSLPSIENDDEIRQAPGE